MERGLDGLLRLNKPPGPTSHDVVAQVRRCLGIRRVGHTGTLDPAASGLLLVVIGRATRLIRFLPHSPKHYRGTIQLGVRTDTDDVTGEVIERHEGPLPDLERVVAMARELEGRSLQVPPAFSARKVGGQRLHRLARQGRQVVAPPAEIDVSRFALGAGTDPGTFAFEAIVSGGTYIRGLARDLGLRLGCGGTLRTLERTRIGPLELAGAPSPPAEGPDDRARLVATLMAPEAMPLAPPACRLTDPDEARRFISGSPVRFPAGVVVPDDRVLRVLNPSGTLLGMAEGRAGCLHPRVVL